MNKSILAVATVALLLGSASVSAQSYQDGYYSESSSRYDDRYDPNYDPRYDQRYDNRSSQGYQTYQAYPSYDQNYDPRYDNRGLSRDDRDCDGLSDRYDNNDSRSVNDRDCDGVSDRYDRYDSRYDGRYHNAGRTYSGTNYHAPRGYRYARYSYGTRLPRGYWGSSYYVDYRPYGLARPPSGYQWNRVGNDVYLVSMRDGMIADIVYSLFR
jgi:Ni/Co efflux regulator RcnB